MIKKEHVIVFNLFFLLDCLFYTLNIQIIIIFICTYNIYISCVRIISKEY